ncbi:MAG: hypothetical protein OEQ47_16060 [Acidimicrobiia bacterium]|nr:hypothetical protein [Acidimicrobiia bacterium]
MTLLHGPIMQRRIPEDVHVVTGIGQAAGHPEFGRHGTAALPHGEKKPSRCGHFSPPAVGSGRDPTAMAPRTSVSSTDLVASTKRPKSRRSSFQTVTSVAA